MYIINFYEEDKFIYYFQVLKQFRSTEHYFLVDTTRILVETIRILVETTRILVDTIRILVATTRISGCVYQERLVAAIRNVWL